MTFLDQLRRRESETQIVFGREQKERSIDTILNIGYVFRLSDGILLDYYLRNKILGKQMDFCPIKEINVYEDHPRVLTGKSRVQYFFIHNRPNQINQSKTSKDIGFLAKGKTSFIIKRELVLNK